MKILLLGAGYVGQALLANWQGGNDQFFVTTTSEEKIEILSQKASQAIVWKSGETEYLKKLVDVCDAMIVTVAPNKNSNYKETYIQCAQDVKESLKDRERPFYLFYTSSTSVYGDHEGKVVEEKSALLTPSEKGQLLVEAEKLFLSCQNPQVTVSIFRLGGICGPGRDPKNRAEFFSGKVLPGNSQRPVNLSYLEDIVEAVSFSFQKQLSGVYNVVSDEHLTCEEYYGNLCKNLGLPPPTWDPNQVSLHGSNAKVSSEKIKAAGFSTK